MTTADVLAATTYSVHDTAQLELVHESLGGGDPHTPVSKHYLLSADGKTPVELPDEVCQALRRAVDAIRNGLSVTVTPTTQTLTTQQAADLLGISRPTLIKALDAHKLPYTRAGTHRRLALTDVLAYREHRRQAQHAALDALAADVDETADISETLEELKRARKTVADRRRSRSAD